MSQSKQIFKGLRKESATHRVFSILAYLLNEAAKTTGKEIKYLHDLFWEYSTSSIIQKVHGTYYSNLEDLMPSKKEMDQAAIKNTIKKLELLDYINIKQNKLSLTKKGAQEYLKYKIEKKKKKKWDSKWRIVTFDILEDKRQIRNLLRSRLKWLGFKELQKSVWIFPYDVEKEIREILEVCNIDIIGDVRFLTVEKINGGEDLRRDFDLK